MLEGLEVSELLFSNIDLGDRIDAEYFGKENIRVEKKLKDIHAIELRNIGKFVASAFYPAATQLYAIGDTPFIRCVDCIKFPLITREQENLFEKIPLQFAKENSGVNLIYKGDLVITKVGTPCYPSLIYEHDVVALSRTVLGITEIKNVNRFYLLAFLRSKYGFTQLQRERELTIQYQLTLERVKKTLIHIPSITFQKEIENLIVNNITLLNLSKITYQQAETLLLDTIGLNNFEPSKEPVNIKSFKDSLLTTGRLDAEYYQKKYEDYKNSIRLNPLGYTIITNEYDLIKSVSKKEKKIYNYIEIGDVNVNDGSVICNTINTEDLPANAKTEVKKGDILISKVRPNRGAVTIIDFEVENLIVSGAFTVLREKKTSIFSNETLKVLLRTELYKDWLLQFNIGTQYPVIRDEDILNIPILKIPKEVQDMITEKIKISQELRKQSEQLLKTAKRAVEIAIEEGEEKVMEMNPLVKDYNC